MGDSLHNYGITHVRVPVGYWLAAYDPKDGYVKGGEFYLRRLLTWLKKRRMYCVIDLHALPCAQLGNGTDITAEAGFFRSRQCYEKGKSAMVALAKLIDSYDASSETSDVIVGFELINEPEWAFWHTPIGIRDLYTEMVPKIRQYLAAHRYWILLNFMDSPKTEGAKWLAGMKKQDALNFENVVYDAHLYHTYGDDNADNKWWDSSKDSCKVCCRDPMVFSPVVGSGLDVIIGAYSL